MLEMPGLWDTCQGELTAGSGTNPRDMGAAVNKADSSQLAEESLDPGN